MSKRPVFYIVILVIVIAGIAYAVQNYSNPDVEGEISYMPESARNLVVISSPRPGQAITSPLTVKGKARGPWYFEATFPIMLVDWDGKIIAEGYATAKDEWMTEEFVPFEGTLNFTDPSWGDDFSKRGALILQKSNPSGLPEHAGAVEMPIRFGK